MPTVAATIIYRWEAVAHKNRVTNLAFSPLHDTADRRHPGKDVLDGSELGLQVPALLMELLSGILAK